MANVVVSAIATFNGKALTKGQKQIKSFEKSVKSLGRTFGIALSAAALVNFSKKAINAFIKDEAAAKSLELQLKNTGYAFSAPDVEYYIANLQKMYGVLDDELRPAFQTLLTASGSITKSQKALNTVLNVSAATGKSVEEVSAAVAKGFNGQTTALTRLGAGLSKATLATGDMDKIMGELDAKFAGQAQARLSTYAGKMDQLKVAAANASEIIGKDLLDSLSAFSKDDTLKGFDDLLSGIASKLAGLDKAVFGFLAGLAGIKKQSVNFTYSLGANAGVELARIQELKARKALIVTLKTEADLKKLKDKYDLERISLMAALNQATDDETKLRLAEKLAILDGNAAMAQKYLADLDATDSTIQLANAMNQAANDILTAGQMILLGLGLNPSQMVGSTISGTAIAGFPDIRNLANVALNNPNFGTSPEAMGLGLALGFTPGSTNMGAPTEAPPINLQLVVDGSAFATAVQSAQLTNNRNGITTVPAGQGF